MEGFYYRLPLCRSPIDVKTIYPKCHCCSCVLYSEKYGSNNSTSLNSDIKDKKFFGGVMILKFLKELGTDKIRSTNIVHLLFYDSAVDI